MAAEGVRRFNEAFTVVGMFASASDSDWYWNCGFWAVSLLPELRIQRNPILIR